MLTQNHRMEGLSRAYVEAVVLSLGLNLSRPVFDYGTDLTISSIYRFPNGRLLESDPRMLVQLKSTTTAPIMGEFVQYDLDSKTYNDLAFSWPKKEIFLILVVFPESESDWLSHTSENLTIHGAGYWFSLRGRKTTKNKRSVRLLIPRSQVFSPSQLTQLLATIEEEDVP